MDETTTNIAMPENPDATNVATERATQVTDDALREVLTRRLSTEHLVAWLEKYGYIAKPGTPKQELIEAILTLHQSQIKESEQTVAAAVAETSDPDEQKVRMKFMSLESPNASYEFTYAGPKGFKVDERGHAIPAPKWCFMHNRTYTVPYWMVKHLNSLQVPADRVVETDTQGFIQSLYSGDTSRQPRFSCTIELTAEQERRMITKG